MLLHTSIFTLFPYTTLFRSLQLKYGLASRLPETGALYKIEVALLKDIATLTIDTSGAGLHKRGYRIGQGEDRKSTRLNSSHVAISYAVFCLKQKTNKL